MKTIKVFASVVVALLVSTVVMAGGKKPSTVKIDAAKSTVNWLAKKVTGQHNGTINLAKGEVIVDGNKLVGSSFDIDMKSIKCLDLQGEWNAKLIGHITTGDFFEVDKFPTASLKITKVEGNNVTGDLTIKGITAPITFPATINVSKTGVEATAKIEIDRTKYGIKYGSKSFFASIGDKAIDDTFTLDVKIVSEVK